MHWIATMGVCATLFSPALTPMLRLARAFSIPGTCRALL
jgi:hypothetical protein